MKTGSVVPAFLDNGQWSACFGLSYLELTLHDTLTSQRIVREGGTYLRKVCGSAGIADGRNEVAANFLDHTDGEWLWFVDTDMGFNDDTVDRLVASADRYQRPVMGGLCFAQRRTHRGQFHAEKFGIIPTLYSYVELEAEVGFVPIADYPRDQVVKVAGTGAACLLIHRRALGKVRQVYGDCWFDPLKHPTGLGGKPRSFSEDLSFCVRLQACDIPVYVDTSVKTCHEKGGLFPDEDAYDAQQRAATKEDNVTKYDDADHKVPVKEDGAVEAIQPVVLDPATGEGEGTVADVNPRSGESKPGSKTD